MPNPYANYKTMTLVEKFNTWMYHNTGPLITRCYRFNSPLTHFIGEKKTVKVADVHIEAYNAVHAYFLFMKHVNGRDLVDADLHVSVNYELADTLKEVCHDWGYDSFDQFGPVEWEDFFNALNDFLIKDQRFIEYEPTIITRITTAIERHQAIKSA